jgi:hypothetical protein
MHGFVQKIVLALVKGIQHTDYIEQCGFSRTGRTHDGDEFPFLYFQVDVFQQKDTLAPRVDPFKDIVQF